MAIEDEYVEYVFPASAECGSERDSLIAAAEHMSIMGTVIAQAGLQFAQAMWTVPSRVSDVAPVDIIQNHLRMLTAGAADDSPIPVTVCCYLARVIHGPEIVERQADIDAVLKVIDDWSSATHTYDELRDLYGKCIALTSGDVEEMGKMLRAVRDRLAAME